VFVIQAPDQLRAHWQRFTEMLRKQFPPPAVPVMEAATGDVLAFLHFPQEHWRKIWSTNPLERLNKEIKRRTNVIVASSPTTPRSPAWWAASCWSSRRNGSWSADASSLRPP
jgi:transposase-like protein